MRSGRCLRGLGWVIALSVICGGCALTDLRRAVDPGPPAVPMRLVRPLPAGFPRPMVPVGNQVTDAKVDLGRHLFFDTALSRDGSYSCASCHRPELAFTDGLRRAEGVTGALHPRSSMSLANVAYGATFNWADPKTRSLERQMLVPMFGEEPVELGLEAPGNQLLERLADRDLYLELFGRAFPEEAEPLTLANLTRALASFERTLISGNSRFDRYLYWDEGDEFPAAARRGMELFFSRRAGCSECHGGFNFSAPTVSMKSPKPLPEFHNTGLYDVDGEGSYPIGNRGLLEQTRRTRDMGRFKAPTLRNIELTAPYMHDGGLDTLEAVVDHYASGGHDSRHRSERVVGFDLSEAERRDLVEFLKSLTDWQFVEWAISQKPG